MVRDVPDDVLAVIDARAQRAGLSRTEYLRRALARERIEESAGVTVCDLARFAQTFAGLEDPEVNGPSVALTAWLIDKSALVRLARSDDAEKWASRIDRGLGGIRR